MAVEYFNPDARAYLTLRKSASCAHKLDYHFVFATKYRRPVLVGRAAEALRDLILAICNDRKLLLLGLSIQPDHVHILIGLKPTDSPAQVAHDLKGALSYRLIGIMPELADDLGSSKLWGKGYSVETLGRSNTAQIDAYLQSQEAHHAEGSVDCG